MHHSTVETAHQDLIARAEATWRERPWLKPTELAELLGVSRQALAEAARPDGGLLTLRVRALGEAPVTVYRLPPEEIAARYGPPVPAPVQKVPFLPMIQTHRRQPQAAQNEPAGREQPMTLAEKVREPALAIIRAEPGITREELARRLTEHGGTHQTMLKILDNLGGMKRLRAMVWGERAATPPEPATPPAPAQQAEEQSAPVDGAGAPATVTACDAAGIVLASPEGEHLLLPEGSTRTHRLLPWAQSLVADALGGVTPGLRVRIRVEVGG